MGFIFFTDRGGTFYCVPFFNISFYNADDCANQFIDPEDKRDEQKQRNISDILCELYTTTKNFFNSRWVTQPKAIPYQFSGI